MIKWESSEDLWDLWVGNWVEDEMNFPLISSLVVLYEVIREMPSLLRNYVWCHFRVVTRNMHLVLPLFEQTFLLRIFHMQCSY